MRITEIIQSKPSSAIAESVIQDVVPQDLVSEECVSAIAEGVSRILRRKYGKGLTPGFRCTSGPRKGRIVAKPETCFARLNPVKGAKIAQKRRMKAKMTAKKRARTMKSGGGSLRLKGAQIRRNTVPLKKASRLRKSSKLQKSSIVKPK